MDNKKNKKNSKKKKKKKFKPITKIWKQEIFFKSIIQMKIDKKKEKKSNINNKIIK
jgi:hypothetical protein